MPLLLLTFGIYLAAVADSTLAPALAIYGFTPCFVLVVAIVWSAAALPSPWRIAQLGFMGLMFDLNTGGHAGVGVACFALAGFVFDRWRAPLRRLGIAEQVVMTAFAAAAMLLIAAAGNRLCGEPMPPLRLVTIRAIGSGIYTAAASLPVWMIVAFAREVPRGSVTRASSAIR